MENFECPNCGGAIPFHASTIFTVCGYCRSMVVREGVNVELIGKTSSLPPDISPIQIGTQGRFGEMAFTVLGRVRMKWRLGAWTEWFIEFADNTTGWLAEAQGFFMVSRAETPEHLPRAHEVREGKALNWRGVPMKMADIKEAQIVGCEGELPYVAPPGRESRNVDLTGPNSAFASIEYSGEEVRSFFGRYCKFEELSFSNLRPVPGWFGNPPLAHETGVNAVNCPSCGGESEVSAPGSAVSVVCGRCGTVLDVSNQNVEVIVAAAKNALFKPVIPLGTRGNLFGVEYEAVGLMQRADGAYSWFEYLLFNPHYGYTWLVTFGGHWNFVERLLDFPEEQSAQAIYEGETYKLFLRGNATVRYVIGEFYWRINFGEKARTTDLIRPPFVLSKEEYPELHEITWSRGRYMEPEQIRASFKLQERLAEPIGIYLNQPNPNANKGLLGTTTAVLLMLLFLVQIVSVARARNEHVVHKEAIYVRGDTNLPPPTIEFDVKGGAQAIKISSYADIANSWIDLGYDLHNTKTGDRRVFTEGIEYYYGSDWSEGGRRKSTTIPSIEPGHYILEVDPDADPQASVVNYHVDVRTDVPVWRDFFACLMVLLVYPAYRLMRNYNFEQKRWAESDYSSNGALIAVDPADYSDDDDDDS